MIRVVFTLLLLSALVFVFFTFVNRKSGSSWQELKDNFAFIESNLSLLKNTFESEESLKKAKRQSLKHQMRAQAAQQKVRATTQVTKLPQAAL